MVANVVGQSQSSDQERALLARLGQARPLEIRRSDDPYGAIWRELQRYSGVQRAKRLFAASLPEKETKTFCAYLELADSYSIVAEDADMELDPLLLYYAAMWLARGVIAAKLGISEAEKVKAHGARPRPASDADLQLLAGTVKINRNGTLPRLIQALGGDDCTGADFRLLELLQALPEMDVVLKETVGFGTSTRAIFTRDDRIRTPRSTVNQITIDFSGTAPNEVNSLPISPALAARSARLVSVTPDLLQISWYTNAAIEEDIATLFMRTADGYFAETRIKGLYVPELAVYLAVLHALSEFTRYYPRDWLDVIADHGADFALIRDFMHFAERKVPELTLNELSGRAVVYRHA